jgi:hypothetical protein
VFALDKVIIVLDPREQLRLQEVCIDKDPALALRFILETLAPKILPRVPCLEIGAPSPFEK